MGFLAGVCLLQLLLFLGSASSRVAAASTPPSARALDAMLQDYAYRAFGAHPHTGIVYNAAAPANLTGVALSAVRLRSAQRQPAEERVPPLLRVRRAHRRRRAAVRREGGAPLPQPRQLVRLLLPAPGLHVPLAGAWPACLRRRQLVRGGIAGAQLCRLREPDFDKFQ
uniref:Uncharacterized protein n=1 Tax=Oryza brachyantha TaxID=4533 RepID=J3LBB3_ORYBR